MTDPTPLDQTGYLAAPGYLQELVHELGGDVRVHDRLVFADGPPRPAAWAHNVWRDPVEIRIESIKSAAKALKAIQRNWVLCSVAQHRRAALIAEHLPHVSGRPLMFPDPAPTAPLGSWTLLDRDRLVAAADCSSPFPNGEARFIENQFDPPNRAYLKLWEALTRIDDRPAPGQTCLDLGSSPGGWTWVLQELGARVISVDKAPLDPHVAASPRVEYRQESAFAVDPKGVGPVDWLCSDIACYPERLLRLVRRWLEEGTVARCVCTLKFQGATDHETAAAFAAIPGSQLCHLSTNKHELTWIWRRNDVD